MSEAIVNYRIVGTRSTVFNVYHYLKAPHWTHAEIAGILNITAEQMAAAVRYIEENKAEVAEVDRQIEERIARGNPPEIEARREASRLKMEAWLAERRRQRAQEANGAGHPGGQ
jgi:uncharacterized protein (DUF433 family)